ncbi:MAG: YfiR family protein [Pseudomonadales bacterium]|nr:YfiR family protein [Pseudomonadales bacterium]
MTFHCSNTRHTILYFLFIALFISSGNVSARSENEIKAAYLYNFIKFITWPDEPTDTDINICIYGKNPFGGYTTKLNSLKARKRAIKVNYIELTPPSDCHILFISDIEETLSEELLKNLHEQPILTISDLVGFTEFGGIIGFFKSGNIIRFNVNLKQARSAKLNISAKLLKLANKVTQ